MNNSAIVFNCSYNGLSIIQELGSKGIKCFAMDSVRGIGTFSKYAKYVRCPNALTQENNFIDFLYGYCKKMLVKPVLFPTNDEWAYAVSKHKEILKEVSIPCVSDFAAIDIIINKDKFYEIGKKENYLTSLTWTWHNANEIEIFPIVAKPKYKAMSGNGINNEELKNIAKSNLRLVKINNKKELIDFIKRHNNLQDSHIFQEYIAGISDCMFTVGVYANKNSDILGYFTGKKVRGFPVEYGDCIVGENFSVPDDIIKNTFRITKEFNYSGIAEFEYKKDSNTGEFKLIEINPRAWSWIGITPYCGVNLPLMAYLDMTSQKVQPANSTSLPNGIVKYAKIYQDFVNCLFRYKHSYPEWNMTYKQWEKGFKNSALIKAELHKGDWLISIVSILYVLIKIIKGK